jgi:hypothetical protein
MNEALFNGLKLYGFDMEPGKDWEGKEIPPHWLLMLPITEQDRNGRIDLDTKESQILKAIAKAEAEVKALREALEKIVEARHPNKYVHQIAREALHPSPKTTTEGEAE